MKNILKSFICAGLLALAFTSCDKEEATITPASLNNLKAETLPGKIILRWDLPAEGSNIEYVKISYHDPRTKIENVRLASVFCDSILIPETRARYNEYSFAVNTVSSTKTPGPNQEIKMISAPASVTTSYTDNQIALEAKDLSTNAQEQSEGPIANLLDGNTGTFFHSSWSEDIPAPHWMQVDLKKSMTACKFYFYRRTGNNSNRPVDIDVMGSTDGQNWFLIRNLTAEKDGLPTASTVNDYTTPVLISSQPFSKIRLLVNKTSNSTVFFTMSEFKVWEVIIKVFDPEKDEVEK